MRRDEAIRSLFALQNDNGYLIAAQRTGLARERVAF